VLIVPAETTKLDRLFPGADAGFLTRGAGSPPEAEAVLHITSISE